MSPTEKIKIGNKTFKVRTVLDHSPKSVSKFPFKGISFGITFIILLLVYAFTLILFSKLVIKIGSIYIVILLAFAILLSIYLPIRFWNFLPFPAAGGGGRDNKALLLVLGIMSIVYSLPALVLYWFINPDHYKKAIEIFVLLVSIGASAIFYDKEQLPTLADKVTYFAGIILTPVGIVEILL